MGNEQSKSSQNKEATLLQLVRKSREVCIGRWMGIIDPVRVEIDDSAERTKPFEEKLGDIPLDVANPEKAVKPAFHDNMDPTNRFKLAVELCIVPEVRRIIESGVSLEEPVDKFYGTPLEYLANCSVCSDDFGGDSYGLSVNCNGADGTHYFRQCVQADAIDVAKLLIKNGASITRKVMEGANKEAFGKPKSALLLLLRKFASDDLVAAFPVYKPNEIPLQWKMEVTDVLKGPNESLPGIWERAASDQRIEKDISCSSNTLVVAFTDAFGRWDVFAKSNGRSDRSFNLDVLKLVTINNRDNFNPLYITSKQIKEMTYDTIDYRISGSLWFLEDKTGIPVESEIKISIEFNALDDWEDWRITGLDDFPVSFIHIGDKIVIRCGPITIIGKINNELLDDGVISAIFVVGRPLLLTRFAYDQFIKNRDSTSTWDEAHYVCSIGDSGYFTIGLPDDTLTFDGARYPISKVSTRWSPRCVAFKDPSERNKTAVTITLADNDKQESSKYNIDLTIPGDKTPYTDIFHLVQELHRGPIKITKVEGLNVSETEIVLATLVQKVKKTSEVARFGLNGREAIIEEDSDASGSTVAVAIPSTHYIGLSDEEIEKRKQAKVTIATELHEIQKKARELSMTRQDFLSLVHGSVTNTQNFDPDNFVEAIESAFTGLGEGLQQMGNSCNTQ